MILALHKPHGVLSQFTEEIPGQRTLAEYGLPAQVYPVGRLDRDSEGLLILSDEPDLVQRLLDPRNAHPRLYHVQVEGIPSRKTLNTLQSGIVLKDGPSRPCLAWVLEPQPEYPPRVPPVRRRLTVPDVWMALELTEGRNRQVRRMTAAVGHPTLRLIRARIGSLELGQLQPGCWRELLDTDREALLNSFRPI